MRNIKRYIDTAVGGIKNEILIRIDLLDKRDRDQFEGARLLIVDSNTIMNKRQDLVETQVKEMKYEVDSIVNKQISVAGKIDTTLENLDQKIDKHLSDEALEFNRIHGTLDRIDLDGSKGVQELRKIIEGVSANGKPGLQASLKDMYDKNEEVHTDIKLIKNDIKELNEFIKPKLMREAWWLATQNLFRSTKFFRFATSKFGFALTMFLIVVLINLVSQAFTGVPLISIDHFLWLFKAIGKLFI